MSKVVYFEVCQKSCSTLSRETIMKMIEDFIDYLQQDCTIITQNENVLNQSVYKSGYNKQKNDDSKKLKAHVDSILCSTSDKNSYEKMQIEDSDTRRFFVYRLSQEATSTETMQHESEELNVASHVILPAVEYQGLWESLYYDTNIKDNLLTFVETAMMFSDRKVDPNIISWNKVVLLHGPPGTGKTSLCKALAQKAAIRLCDRYAYVELVEINSHSLFSKWFSESGKLVMKLFDEVKRLLDNPGALVCILIDEIESLAHARKSCANGTEPSDAIRVVNALLTQLDQIKSYPNVLILTTSNVTEAIDLAFVDRADIKQYIGHPQERAIYQIYRSCLMELMRTKLLTDVYALPIEDPHRWHSEDIPIHVHELLKESCKKSIGLSGRSLRKIPFLAYAMSIQTGVYSLEAFLEIMVTVIKQQKENDCLYK